MNIAIILIIVVTMFSNIRISGGRHTNLIHFRKNTVTSIAFKPLLKASFTKLKKHIKNPLSPKCQFLLSQEEQPFFQLCDVAFFR